MFKALREKLLGASKQAEEELDPQLNLDYETFRPEERESGAVIRESHLENVLWEMELALLQSDLAMEALEEIYEGIQLACKNYDVDLVGGDTTSSNTGLIISICLYKHYCFIFILLNFTLYFYLIILPKLAF